MLLFPEKISEKYLALLFLVIIVTISIVFAFSIQGFELAILIALAQCVAIFFAKNIWLSDESNFILRSVSLGITSLLVINANTFWQSLLQKVFQKHFPRVQIPDNTASPLVLLFLLVLVSFIFYFTQEKAPTLQKPEKSLNKVIQEVGFKDKWKNICKALESQIRDIDHDTNWSSEYYTPLEAEVEIKTSDGKQKVLSDLLKAIKASNDRLFLLIGDPGSGKSVAMRKLCLDLLQESVKNERIPIYVNLKEWNWSQSSPSVADLEIFVKQTLKRDRFVSDFFDKYFDLLNENGNLFFVLDSFDEIPNVLGISSDSQLISDLTIVCRDFLRGAKNETSKGILASREFRMPRENYFDAKTFLRIRPFTREKIEEALTKSGKISSQTVKLLFKERTDLIPILRNPFISSLFCEYLKNNNHQFPQNQSALFSDYIEKSIEDARSKLDLTHIEYSEIFNITIKISEIIFSEKGLQSPISYLRKKVTNENFDDVIQLLRYTRIARGYSHNATEFSFAHRRFYEYFVVYKLLQQGESRLSLENIPTDSRWRDTLVLYCEVAPIEEAKRIANYCWNEEIKPIYNIRNSRSKHCLRFLIEAYRSIKSRLDEFEDEIAIFVTDIIEKNEDAVDVKIAVEALGILNDKNLSIGTKSALKIGDSWINETALRGCRHLHSIDKDLEKAIMDIIDPNPLFWFFKKNIRMTDKELAFSLSLSEAFKEPEIILDWQKKKRLLTYSLIPIFLLCVYILYFFGITPEEPFIDHIGNYFLRVGILFAIVSFGAIYPTVNTHFNKSKYRNERVQPFNIVAISTTILCSVGLILFLIKLGWSNFASPWVENNIIPVVKNSSFINNTYFILKIIGIILLVIIFFAFLWEGLIWITSKIKILFGKDHEARMSEIINPIIQGIFFLSLLGMGIWLYLNNWLLIASLIILLIFVIYFFNEYKSNEKKFQMQIRKIQPDTVIDRSQIEEIINLYQENNKRANQFIRYLEANIKRVKGSYTSTFLKAGISEAITNLAQLEEKWREAQEREEEEQRLKKTQGPKRKDSNIKRTLIELIKEGKFGEAMQISLGQIENDNELILLSSRLSLVIAAENEGTVNSENLLIQKMAFGKAFISWIEDNL